MYGESLKMTENSWPNMFVLKYRRGAKHLGRTGTLPATGVCCGLKILIRR